MKNATLVYLLEMTSKGGTPLTFVLQQWQIKKAVERAIELGHKVHSVERLER